MFPTISNCLRFPETWISREINSILRFRNHLLINCEESLEKIRYFIVWNQRTTTVITVRMDNELRMSGTWFIELLLKKREREKREKGKNRRQDEGKRGATKRKNRQEEKVDFGERRRIPVATAA